MKVAFRTVWFQIPIFRGLGGSSMKKLTLGDVCKKESSNIAQKDIMECEGEYPIYGAGGFIKNVNFYQQELPYIAVVKDGAGIGRTMLLPAYSSVIGTMQYILPIDYESIDLQYLYYAIVHMDLGKYFSGATIPHIYFKDYKKEKLFLPEICEQQRISLLLKQVDLMIEKQNNQVELVDKLVQSRFVEMFGNPVLNEKGWRTKPLLDMGNCKNGMNFHYDDCGVEINCLGVGDFKDLSVIDDTKQLPTVSLNEMPSEEYLLKDNDIVFVRSNGNKELVGRSIAVYPGNVATTFSGFCIRYRKYDDEVIIPYLLRVLKTDSIRRKMAGRGANIQNLNQQILGTLIVPIPPLELQNRFADFVQQVDKSKSVIQKSLDELEILKRSLMQKRSMQ